MSANPSARVREAALKAARRTIGDYDAESDPTTLAIVLSIAAREVDANVKAKCADGMRPVEAVQRIVMETLTFGFRLGRAYEAALTAANKVQPRPPRDAQRVVPSTEKAKRDPVLRAHDATSRSQARDAKPGPRTK